MVELGKRGEDVGVACLTDADAEVHIVEGHGIALVQTAHFVVDLLADEQAGGGVSVDVLHIVQAAHIAVGAGGIVLVQMARHAADTEADTGVLDGIVRVEQLGTHAAHPLLLGIHDHLFQPGGGDDLGVVVEQKQILTGGELLAEVVQGAVIEALALPGDDLEVIGVLFLHPLIGPEGLGGLAVVLDEDDLKIRVGGAGVDGLHAGLQVADVVAGGDEDAHPARMVDGVVGLVVARRTRDEGHIVHGHAAAGVMSLEGSNARVDAVGLGGDVAGRAAGAGTPVIEGVGDVDDLPGRLGQAEEELIILTAVVLHPLRAACGVHQPAAEEGQVADIVVGAEVVQHEVRLEVVEHHVLHLALEGRLIGIDEVGSLLGDGLGGVPEGAGMEDVVVVQQGDEVAGGHLDAFVGVAGDELILLQLPVADTRVHSGALLHHLAHARGSAGVHTAELPIAVGLVHDGIQQLFEEVQRGVVERHHDADPGACRLIACLPHQQFHRCEPVGAHDFAREEGGVLAAGAGQFPHTLDAAAAQLPQEHEEGQSVPELAALADDIAHGPGHLPELRAGHLAQCLFQLLLVAAAERKVAAQPGDEFGFLAAGALGAHHPVTQDVHFHLVAPHHLQLSGLAGAEQRRLRGAALAAPAKIAEIPSLGQLLGPARHNGALIAHQQHPGGQGLGQRFPRGVCHHQKLCRRALCPLFCLHTCTVQGFRQQGHLLSQQGRRGGVCLLRDALRQCAAALPLPLFFLFLLQLHSVLSTCYSLSYRSRFGA